MKKQIFFTVTLSLFFVIGAMAQPLVSVTIDEVEREPGTVLVPVYADFSDAPGDGVGSIELTIAFDPAILVEFNGLENEGVGEGDWVFPTGSVGGQFKLNWEDFNNPTKFEGKLFDLVFEYAGDYSDISFVGPNQAGITEIGGEDDASPIISTFNDGSITEDVPAVPIALLVTSDWFWSDLCVYTDKKQIKKISTHNRS